MNFKTVASSLGVVAALFGVAFLLAPLPTLAIYGNQSADPVLAIMTRYFGSALLATAAFAWGLRGIENVAAQRAAAMFIAVVTLTGAGVSLQAALAGTLNAMAWSSVAIYLIFAALWARIAYLR